MDRRKPFLGFYLNHNIAGDKEQMERACQRGNSQENNIRALHMYHGEKTKHEAVEGLCKATIHATIAANLTLHQMTTKKGHDEYDKPRRVQAKAAKSMLGTSQRVSPQIILMELRWKPIDADIIATKLRLFEQLKMQPKESYQNKVVRATDILFCF